MPGKSHVISLYKQMLTKGRQLQFTDKHFYYRRIRDEFEKNRYLTKEADISFAIQVYLKLLKIFNYQFHGLF